MDPKKIKKLAERLAKNPELLKKVRSGDEPYWTWGIIEDEELVRATVELMDRKSRPQAAR